jgi:hypothetical protein
MTVLEMLQLCLIGQRSGRIDCQAHGQKGQLEIRTGQVVHASSGAITGEPAFFALVTTPGVEGQFLPNEDPVERNISAGTDFLLMEAARRADEMAKNTPPPPVGVPKISITQLTVISDPVPKVFELGAPALRLGRALDNDIILSVESVSGHHCRLELKSMDYWISDSGSRNGTFVNNRKVEEPVQLRVGDLIQLGAALLRCGSGDITPAVIKRRTAKIHQVDTQDLVLPPRQPGGAPSTYQAVNLPPHP